MRYSFRNLVLITLLALLVSCRTGFVQSGVNTRNIPVSAETAHVDSSIVKLYSPYKNVLDKEMNQVIAFSERTMEKGKPESLLTNFLGDLLLEEAKQIAPALEAGIEPSLSYLNYGGIRTSLPKGDITLGKIYELMPFENELVYLEMKGTLVREFLDALARKGGDSVGGVRFKIVEGKASEITIQGQKLEPDKTYWIATNDYVANGGDNMLMLKQNERFVGSGKLIRDLIVDYLEKLQNNNQVISAKMDGRISNE